MSSINSSNGGIPSVVLYNQIVKTGETTEVANYVKSTPLINTQEQQFDQAVKQLGSDPNALFKNYNLLNFVLTAFGVQDQVGNIGLLEKVVTSDLNDSKSLANQLNDAGLTQLTQVLQTDGSINASLQDPTIQGEIKNAFEVASYENNLAQTNPAVVQALDFTHLVSNVKSIYDIMGNSTLRAVVQTNGNIPQTIVNQDLTAQAAVFSQAFDVSKVNDPQYIQTYVQRFLAVSDANAASSTPVSSPALTILQDDSSSDAGQIISLDIGSIINFKA